MTDHFVKKQIMALQKISIQFLENSAKQFQGFLNLCSYAIERSITNEMNFTECEQTKIKKKIKSWLVLQELRFPVFQ